MKVKHILSILGILAIASCRMSTPVDQPLVSTDQGIYQLGADGGDVTITVYSTVDWKAVVYPGSSRDNVDDVTSAGTLYKADSLVWTLAKNSNFTIDGQALKVAVANSDEGFQSDAIPVKINLGERVASDLSQKKTIGYVVTTEEDAIEGVRSGEYYAALVIPEDFTKDMLTVFSDDIQQAVNRFSGVSEQTAVDVFRQIGTDQPDQAVNPLRKLVTAQ